ncbi:MAG TPA: hypothetical protein VFA23_10760, partial [Dongiaceae bacterium]|nr:hypothetical protein [Dongiaceae bacterium]
AGDNILSRRPFVASAKAVIADATGEAGWRRVLPPLSELPLAEEQRMIADMRRWQAGLAPGLRSLYPDEARPGAKVVSLRG